MARNKSFNITIKINEVDYTEYCSIQDIKISKNLDHTQIFTGATIIITNTIGISSEIKKNDKVSITIYNTTILYRVANIKTKISNTEIQLKNIFELLKEKRFLILNDQGNKIINPLLSSFESGGSLISGDLGKLIEMILTLATEEDQYDNLEFDYTVMKSYNPISQNLADLNPKTEFSLFTINNTYLDWMDNTTPSQLLEDLQKIFCFNISIINDVFQYISLPILQTINDYELPLNNYTDFDFFSLKTIMNDLDPLQSVSKTSYLDSNLFIAENKKPLKVFDIVDLGAGDEENIFFEYEYRNDLDIESIELPRNLNLKLQNKSQVFQPMKFQLLNGKYYLKTGFYQAYLRFFGQDDIIQDSAIKLDYQKVLGYNKIVKKFTNESDEGSFTDPKQSRETIWNNESFFVNLTINKPVLRNSIRG